MTPAFAEPSFVVFAAFLSAGAFAGGFVNGLAGFGTALFALGFWLQVLAPVEAVALSLVLAVASGVPGMWEVRRAIRWRRLLWFLVPALAGIPIGLRFLRVLDPETLKLVVAVFLLTFGGWLLLRRTLPRAPASTPAIDAGIGFTGGALGALAGLSGALPTIWTSLKGWPKAEQRAVLQPYNVIVLGLCAGILAAQGVYGGAMPLRILGMLPATLLGMWLGLRLFRRLETEAYRRLLIALMVLSGASILAGRMF